MSQTISGDDARIIPAKEVRRLLGISNMTLYRLHTSGRFPTPKKINKRNFWRLADVRAWIDAL